MSTSDNKIKIQLRPSLPGASPGVINRADKNPSPSKLMINHGKPNYTITRNTASPKNKPIILENSSTMAQPTLSFSLKPTTVSPIPTPSSSNEIEKIVLKHVSSPLNQFTPTEEPSKPTTPMQQQSFISPGISSKAAATSFGVKLKHCNQKSLQNGGNIIVSNSKTCDDEPEFVKRQKKIFEKLQQREQQNNNVVSNANNQELHDKIKTNSEINSKFCSQNEDISNNYVRSVADHLESSTALNNQQCQNSRFKLPVSNMKPAIPGKPANLHIPLTRLISQQQQQHANKIQNGEANLINQTETQTEIQSHSESLPINSSENFSLLKKEILQEENLNEITINTNKLEHMGFTENLPEHESVDIISEKTTEEIEDSQLVEAVLEEHHSPQKENISAQSNIHSNGVNFEQKTFVSFSKDLSTEPNRYPDVVKVTKSAITNGNGFMPSNDQSENLNEYFDEDDRESVREFLATENTIKLAEEMAQLKFEIKTSDEQDVSIEPVVIR